ncbi:MAG: hypothetical protein QW580_01950 [Nitrososphaerota archaeon]
MDSGRHLRVAVAVFVALLLLFPAVYGSLSSGGDVQGGGIVQHSAVGEENRASIRDVRIKPAVVGPEEREKSGPPKVLEYVGRHGTATVSGESLKPEKPRTMQVFEAVEIDPVGWSRLVDEGGRYVWVTRWGNYSIEKNMPMYVRYVFRTPFTTLKLNATAGYSVEVLGLEVRPVSAKITHVDDYNLEYVLDYVLFRLHVSWRFSPGYPGSKAWIEGSPILFRVLFKVEGLNGGEEIVNDGVLYRYGTGDSWLNVDFSEEYSRGGRVELHRITYGILARFDFGKKNVDPSLYVVAPGTVTVDFGTTGDKTLLQITDNLPSGNKVVIFAVGWDSASNIAAQGYLKIVSGDTLVQEGITRYLNYGGMMAKHSMLFAYHANAPANAQYTLIATVTTAATGSSTLHVQGMVILLGTTGFFATGSNTNIAAGATVTLATVTTNFPAGSKVAVLAYVQMGRVSGVGHVLYPTGNIRILKGSSIVSQNQFQVGTYEAIEPAHVSLSYFDTGSSANQAYSIQVRNSLLETSQAWGEIIAFTVADGAFLDTGNVSLTSGSQVTVGNLTTSLSGEVGVIALAAAENTGTTDVTAFNAGDVVLQLNNQGTGQVANRRGWLLERTSYSGRSGVYALFRVDTGVSSPSYQVKMTSRASGINGEAKILAFHITPYVTIKYSVVGNNVQGQIIMRYYFLGVLRRLVLSTSYQSVYVDNNTVINVDYISSGSTNNERWAYSGDGNFTAVITQSMTFDLLYYNQLRVTLYAFTQSPYTATLSPSNHARVNTTYLGTIKEWRVWDGSNNASWVDRGGRVSWYQTSNSSTSTHRWATAGSVTLENVQSPSTSSAYFWDQWRVTWRIQMAVNSTALASNNYVYAKGKQFGGDLTLSPLYYGYDQTDWVDHYSNIYIATPSTGSNSTRRWVWYGVPYNVSSSGTYYFTVQEELWTRLRLMDADNANPIKLASSVTVKQYNGSIIIMPITDSYTYAWFQANVGHSISKLVWNGYSVENGTASWSQFPAPKFRPTTANSTILVPHPRIWANLGGSGTEIWLRSQSIVTSVIWDGGRLVLYVQSEKASGEAYYWYGSDSLGTPPKYVYIDGVLFSDVGYTVDHTRQVVKITVGGGSFLFDHSGKTQPPPATDVQSLVQQLYAIISGIRPAAINVTQPTGPPIRIPVLDLSWIVEIAVAAVRWIDAVSPVKSSILLPAALFLTVILGFLSLSNRLRHGKAREWGGGRVAEVRIRETPQTSLLRMLLSVIVGVVISTLAFYYVLPRVFPHVFQAPPQADIRLLIFAGIAVAALGFAIVAIIAYLPRTGRVREG